MKWLDNFSMRSFTNDSIFDDTLPVADGSMRIGTRVPLEKLKEAMEDWFKQEKLSGERAGTGGEEVKLTKISPLINTDCAIFTDRLFEIGSVQNSCESVVSAVRFLICGKNLFRGCFLVRGDFHHDQHFVVVIHAGGSVG